jgi:xylose isomerase
MLEIVGNGGLGTGGCNFDAKLRRQSVDPNDLYIAHIAGIDTLARALLAAESIIKDKKLAKLKADRYAGWSTPFGQEIAEGKYTLAALADQAVKKNLNPAPKSGKQELAEAIIAAHCKF